MSMICLSVMIRGPRFVVRGSWFVHTARFARDDSEAGTLTPRGGWSSSQSDDSETGTLYLALTLAKHKKTHSPFDEWVGWLCGVCRSEFITLCIFRKLVLFLCSKLYELFVEERQNVLEIHKLMDVFPVTRLDLSFFSV